jgi:hypothetical protein
MSDRRFSAGIEAVLLAAVVDEAFERALLADREAARQRGLQLSDEELAVLRATSDEQLRLFVEQLRREPPRPPAEPDPSEAPVCTGIRPDLPPSRLDPTPMPPYVVAPQGIRADVPPPQVMCTGILPDVPPRRQSWLDRLLRRK